MSTNLEMLFHVSSEDRGQSIIDHGVYIFAHWTPSLLMVDYYAELIGSRNKVPIVVAVELSKFDKTQLSPDYSSLDDPPTNVLKTSRREIKDLWETSSQTWEDSMSIIKSVRYDDHMHVEMLDIHHYINSLDLALEISRDKRHARIFEVRNFHTNNTTSKVDEPTLYDKILAIL